MNFDSRIRDLTAIVDSYLDASMARFGHAVSPRFSLMVEAMGYSLAGGGKRFRPLLMLGAAEYLGIEHERILPAACAIEYIHTYSLIHDDLPALDNDDVRRGKPASHKQFGEAVAILTGDALLTEAFGQMLLLEELGFGSKDILGGLSLLVQHSGVRGMVGGQLLDVSADSRALSLPEVEFIHIHKTGALILLSVILPARLAGVGAEKSERLKRYGEAIGLAFQISDDLLDIADASRQGATQRKPSLADYMTPSEMRERVVKLTSNAIDVLGTESERTVLEGLARFLLTRLS